MFNRFLCPATSTALPVQLVLPRNALHAHLLRKPSLAGSTESAQFGTLAHGPLRLQKLGLCTQALVPYLKEGAPQRLPVVASLALANRATLVTLAGPEALALMYCASPRETRPSVPAEWEIWLASCAPEFRLACTALVPDVVVLWLQADGQASAWLRTGDSWVALHGTPTHPSWRQIEHLALPGAHMLDTQRDGSGLTDPAPTAEEPSAIRYSRLAGALGPKVLQRLQNSLWLVVGCDTTGSMLAHSLARMGVNLLVLDPAPMAAYSLDADLPSLHEGKAKPIALQHLLRELLRPGARCDARALSVASPTVGNLMAMADGMLCCTSNSGARLWANAWAQALLKPLLAVRTAAHPAGFEAELHLLPPGTGCLVCSGNVPALATVNPPKYSKTPRSWQGVAAHATLRLLEHLYDGRAAGPVVRHIAETENDGLRVQDRHVPSAARLSCPVCHGLAGAGMAAVQRAMLSASGRKSAS